MKLANVDISAFDTLKNHICSGIHNVCECMLQWCKETNASK